MFENYIKKFIHDTIEYTQLKTLHQICETIENLKTPTDADVSYAYEIAQLKNIFIQIIKDNENLINKGSLNHCFANTEEYLEYLLVIGNIPNVNDIKGVIILSPSV